MIGTDAVLLARERFGLESGEHGPSLPRERLLEFARALFEAGYVYLVYISAMHHLADKQGELERPARYTVVYRVRDLARERFGLESPEHGPSLPRERLLEFAQALFESGYVYLVYISAMHHLADKQGELERPARYTVVYRVRDLARGLEFPFRCEVPLGTSVPSLAGVWAGADWQEREAFDLVGPVFEGHPDLRRIMLPEDWEGHPLHRDYAINTPHSPWR